MKQLIRSAILFCACAALAFTAVAGSESISSGKEMKQVAPAPVPECDWTGFYIGVNAGGQFGHSEDKDLDDFWIDDRAFGYSESGFVGGGQVGYNFQWNWVVLGIEADGGYMNLDGNGDERPSVNTFPGPATGFSDSDFYTTIRGRLGVAFNHWLLYGTGGGIGVNYETRFSQLGTGRPDLQFRADKTDFNWGYTVGGGIEYMLNCHWSLRAEYLYFVTDDQRFNIHAPDNSSTFRFDGHTEGNIVRAGLNYKF